MSSPGSCGQFHGSLGAGPGIGQSLRPVELKTVVSTSRFFMVKRQMPNPSEVFELLQFKKPQFTPSAVAWTRR